MLFQSLGTVLLLISAADKTTVCDRFQQSDFVFTGSAEDKWIAMLDTHKSPIHKRSEKAKRVRFLVREWFKGQRQDTMEVWITPSACPLKIEANQMYLIFARMNKDKNRIETDGCMGTALVTSAPSDMSYLNASLKGAGMATRIAGTAGSGNLNIQATSGIDTRYAITDGAGRFAFEGLPPGKWDVSIVGGTPRSVDLPPNGCVTEDLGH